MQWMCHLSPILPTDKTFVMCTLQMSYQLAESKASDTTDTNFQLLRT